jgi:hypothetical protein
MAERCEDVFSKGELGDGGEFVRVVVEDLLPLGYRLLGTPSPLR